MTKRKVRCFFGFHRWFENPVTGTFRLCIDCGKHKYGRGRRVLL